MKPSDNRQSDLQNFGLGGSIVLLVLHFYYYCFELFKWAGLSSAFSDRLMASAAKTGLFAHTYTSKLLVMAFLVISLMVTNGRKDRPKTWQYALKMLGAGLVLFFGTGQLLDYLQGSLLWIYIGLTVAGFLLMLHGGHSLHLLTPGMAGGQDAFGKRQSGFPQDEKRRPGPFAVNLPGRYRLKGQERESWVNIVNARRGVLLIGTPGCGKSRFVIEPFLRQIMSKGMAVFLFDYKFDALSQQAYALFQEYLLSYPPGSRFCCINFTDLSRSHRCNVLAPSTLQQASDAQGISKIILLSLNKSWIHQQGNFFVESPMALLAAIIWWLKLYKNGDYCTLPHVIEFCMQSYDKLFSLLNDEPSTRHLINPFVNAYQGNAKDQLEGQMASLKVPLGKLVSDDIYYLLSDSDFSLSINDPKSPTVFCLGGDPRRAEALAPILSLYADRVNVLVNQPKRHPVALIYDEFPTIRAFSILQTITTARSNDVIPLLAVQDLSQLRISYSHDEASAIMNVCGNVICGQASGDTARWMAEHIPKLWQERNSMNSNSHDTSFGSHHQWEDALTPATIANLSSGEFVGVVADDPDTPLDLKAFHAKLRREDGDLVTGPLPVVRTVNQDVVRNVAKRIRQDVEVIVHSEYERILLQGRAITGS